MTEETTEKKRINGFLPWIVSMKVDEHADVTSSLPCRPLYLLSALIFLSCSFFLLLCHLLQPFCGRAAALCGPAEPQQKHICCFQQTGLIYSETLLIRSCKCQRGNMKAFVPKCQMIRLITDARVYLAVCHECHPASDSHIKATTFYFILFLNETFQQRC